MKETISLEIKQPRLPAMSIGDTKIIDGTGENGATFYPSVSADGVISWTNNKGLENPEPVNIRGGNGKDGYSPTINISKLPNGNRVTINDKNGTEYIDILNGADGQNGSDGVGIKSVEKTATNGEFDTYTFTFTDGKTFSFTIKNGKDGEDGADGRGISSIVKSSTNGLIDNYTINFTDGSKTTFSVTNGKNGVDGTDGKDGTPATHEWQGTRLVITSASGTSSADLKGDRGIQGIQGEKGDPFFISKVYNSVAEMHADYSNNEVKVGQFIVIETGNVNDEDNAKLFIKGNTSYEFLTDLSGAQGMQGPAGIQGEQGVQGPAGVQGVGIRSIAKTDTQGIRDIYTITLTDGGTATFSVTNGTNGNDGVSVTNASIDSNGNLVISLSNQNELTLGKVVGSNGKDGADGTSVTIERINENHSDGGSSTIFFSDGNSINIKNGATGGKGADGKNGTSVTITKVTESTADGGSNVVNFSDGKSLSVKNGSKGSTGVGISKIEKTSTNGKVDTYTITLTNGTKTTFTVTNGVDGKDADTAPDYVVAEAEETAKKVLGHQSADSFALAWLSDMHVGHVYQALGWKPDETSVIEAGQGLYELNKECPVDVIALGGDLAAGVHNTTREVGLDQIDKCEKYMRPATFLIPTLHLRGNHDDAPYQATEGRLTPNDVFQRIGRKNISSGANIVKGKNYGYRDFEAQKMRVIYLDTHDKEGWVSTQFVLNEDDSCPYLNACNVSAAQLDWLANTALNFSDKEAPSEWGIVICSHTQLNIHATPWTYTDETTGTSYEANTTNVITILTAYLTKGSGSITLNGETMSYDFSTLTDKAYLYCCINGHNHCEKTYTYGAKGILGIACPAVRDGAERVSADGNTYTKTAGTGNSTSFTVITIDRVNNKIYADIHGAGTDREFDVVVYSDYTNVLETAYTPPTANNVTPIDTSVFDGLGYRNGVRLSGWTLSSNADYVATGVIKWRENPDYFPSLKPIYIKGANAIFDATNRKYVRCNIIQINAASGGLYNSKPVEDAADWAETFTIETLGENYYKLTPIETGLSSWYNVCYIQFSLFGTGDNLIITIDEPIG